MIRRTTKDRVRDDCRAARILDVVPNSQTAAAATTNATLGAFVSRSMRVTNALSSLAWSVVEERNGSAFVSSRRAAGSVIGWRRGDWWDSRSIQRARLPAPIWWRRRRYRGRR